MKLREFRAATVSALLACAAMHHVTAQTPDGHTIACSPTQPVVTIGGTVAIRVFLSPVWNTPSVKWSATGGGIGSSDDVRNTWTAEGEAGQSVISVVVSEGSVVQRCSVRVLVIEDALRGRDTGLAVVGPSLSEPDGYALYSYLLLSQRPSAAAAARYRQLIDAAIRMVPGLVDLQRFLPRSELNYLAVPVSAELAAIAATQKGRSITVTDVLEHYDYARARAWLAKLNTNDRDGPYLVSVRAPISSAATVDVYLRQDLSAVPPALVGTWVAEFLNQAAQERAWGEVAGPSLALRMRTALAQLALGYPDLVKAMPNVVQWIAK